MNFLQSLLYGLLSGLAEFLPVSAGAHQAILVELFGVGSVHPLCVFLIHLACLAAAVICCYPAVSRLQREFRFSMSSVRGRKNRDKRTFYELKLLKMAIFPLLLGILAYGLTMKWANNLILLTALLILNGIIIMVPEYMAHGNRTAKHMSTLDGIGVGIAGALSALPGISRIGTICAYSLARGVDRQTGLNWALLLSIPALALMILLDFIGILSTGFSGIDFLVALGYILAAIVAFVGAYGGILLIRFLTVRTGSVAFAYYNLGAALFALILYLLV